jgi:hypothetical protein
MAADEMRAQWGKLREAQWRAEIDEFNKLAEKQQRSKKEQEELERRAQEMLGRILRDIQWYSSEQLFGETITSIIKALGPESPEELLLNYVLAAATAAVGTWASKALKARKLRKVLTESSERLLKAADDAKATFKIGSLGELTFEARMRAEGAIIIKTQYGTREGVMKGFDRGLIFGKGKDAKVVIAEVKHWETKEIAYKDLTALGSNYKETLMKNKRVFTDKLENILAGKEKLHVGMSPEELEKHRPALEAALDKLKKDDFEIMIAVKDKSKLQSGLLNELTNAFPGKKITIIEQEQ